VSVNDERVPSRIWQRIRENEAGCWIWTGGMDHTGYGRTKRLENRHRSIATHRLMYELLVGPIPEGLDLDHLCRVRACCNPAHMEAVTRQVNVLRGHTVTAANAKKTHCNHGHPLEGENLRISKKGSRECAECCRRRLREQKERMGIDEWRRRDRERWAQKRQSKRGAA
jgi:hypothetical protein